MNPVHIDDIILSSEEQAIEEAIGDFSKADTSLKSKEQARIIAKNTIEMNESILLKLSMRDRKKLQIKSIEKGLSEEALATAILHQYANSQLPIAI